MDREPRASALSDSRARTHPSPDYRVAWAQLVLDGFARAVVRGPTAGGYGAQSLQLSRRGAGPWTPDHESRALEAGPLVLAA